jgi:hypothetical protein
MVSGSAEPEDNFLSDTLGKMLSVVYASRYVYSLLHSYVSMCLCVYVSMCLCVYSFPYSLFTIHYSTLIDSILFTLQHYNIQHIT